MFTSNSFELNVVSHYLNIISFRFCLSVSLVTSHTACWPVMKRMTQSLASRAPSRRSQILSRLEMHHWICLTSICYPSEFLIALVSRQGEDWISYKLWQTVKFNIPLSKKESFAQKIYVPLLICSSQNFKVVNLLQYNTMPCNALRCNAMQSRPMQSRPMQSNTLQYNKEKTEKFKFKLKKSMLIKITVMIFFLWCFR